ncbi:30S ribosomal protein [Dillenia turbinata]|uniref:30S ribosomal protein n=1 Tax=Dillenia turbinata TaxID=194707 RepID=A0AAN8UVG6_9MAGN
MAMMMQWFGAASKRILTSHRYASMSSLSAPLSSSSSAVAAMPILCGRGDKRTKRGKRFKGSYGNARPKKEKKIERIKDKIEVPRVLKNPELALLWHKTSNSLEYATSFSYYTSV